MKRLAAAVAAVAFAVAVAGCSVFSSLLNTKQALQNAGYSSVSVNFDAQNSNEDIVRVSVSVAAPPSNADVRNVASVVWQQLHEKFDTLQLTVNGQGPKVTQSLAFGQLQTMFGARNPAWNRTSLRNATESIGVAVIGVVLVLAAAAVVLIAFTVRRRRLRGGMPSGKGARWWSPNAARRASSSEDENWYLRNQWTPPPSANEHGHVHGHPEQHSGHSTPTSTDPGPSHDVHHDHGAGTGWSDSGSSSGGDSGSSSGGDSGSSSSGGGDS